MAMNSGILTWVLSLMLLSPSALCIRQQQIEISGKEKVGFFPPSCSRIECPDYEVLSQGDGFEIRQYNSATWASTQAIDDISLVDATRTGFLQLFDYIQGKNEYKEKIEMTSPVITEVGPSAGPFCASSFVISFYVPKKNQPNPAPAVGLHIQRWGPRQVAVRQFGGFVSDDSVGQEAAALYDSLAGTEWQPAVNHDGAAEYTVAQYNSPFEFTGRVNEIWLPLKGPSSSL